MTERTTEEETQDIAAGEPMYRYKYINRNGRLLAETIYSREHSGGTVDAKGRSESYLAYVTEYQIELIALAGAPYSFCHESERNDLERIYRVTVHKMKDGRLFGAFPGSYTFENRNEALAFVKKLAGRKVNALVRQRRQS